MSKKQKMKMLAAVLAAGSLYINSGTAFAVQKDPSMPGVGFANDSENDNVTIMIGDPTIGDIFYGGEEGEFGFDSSGIFKDENPYTMGFIGFSSQEGKDGQDSKLLITSTQTVTIGYDEAGKPIIKHNTTTQSVNGGSTVRVNETQNGVTTGLYVNGNNYDINSTEFSNSGFVGDTQNKGGWTVTDKTTGKEYKDTTLGGVETSKTEDGYGINYDIYDTAGNKVELAGAASADKLKEVDNKTVTGGNINSETGKITINKQDGSSFELQGQLSDSQLVSGELNKNTGELTLVSEDKYTHEQTTVTVNDIASKENLDNLTEVVGAKDTASLNESYKDTTYINGATNMVDADIKLDAAIKEVVATAGQHTSISNGDNNIVVTPSKTPNANGGVNYEVSLNDHITLGDITVNKDNSGIIGGLSNKEWNWNDYNDNKYKGSSNAATEGQLHGAMQGTVQYDRNEDGSVNKGSITLGGEGGTSIHNVAPGRVEQGSMDAVNGGQLYDMQQNMGNRINNLDNRISKVGAGAAALAALHPLDFDPDDKLSFAVGYGNYRGENAAAVGAFYQPNEDTLFSLGGTVGNDENMVNVGVSFKLGQKNHVSNNRVSMAKEIISLRDKVAKLEALMTQQGLIPQSEVDMDKFFPDVPENHWAYEYVKELARLGILDGYPDGTFSGDRMMTRYEFAAITYRALQKGVNVDKRMVTEFEPELKLIRVDVVAQDKDGNPTIERVRTNEQK